MSDAYRIIYAPDARRQLLAIDRYISREASADIARKYTDAIVEYCDGLAAFPHRGTPRNDIRTGVRTMSFRRRVTIAYEVGKTEVTVLALYYAGKNITKLPETDNSSDRQLEPIDYNPAFSTHSWKIRTGRLARSRGRQMNQ